MNSIDGLIRIVSGVTVGTVAIAGISAVPPVSLAVTITSAGAVVLGVAEVAVGVTVIAAAVPNLISDHDKFEEEKKKANESVDSKYDANGNYTGGRSQKDLDALAKYPAHAGSTRQIDIDKGLHERKIGLSLEESGKLKGPIIRDPTGASEFFDVNGQAWDIKSFNSSYKPSKGGYTLQKSIDSILDSISKKENIILDTSNLSSVHKTELLQELSKQGLLDKVITWP